jgi:hypothetical protein
LLQAEQEGAGQQRERDVMMPAAPAAHLVLVQTDFALERLELSLDFPSRGLDLCQTAQIHLRRGIGEGVSRLLPFHVGA